MALLKQFQADYTEFERRRQELTNAERLFDLPITLYPDLIEVEKELRSLSKVYELYEAQRVGLYICMVLIANRYVYLYIHVSYFLTPTFTLSPSHPHTLTPSHSHPLTLSHPHTSSRWPVRSGQACSGPTSTLSS